MRVTKKLNVDEKRLLAYAAAAGAVLAAAGPADALVIHGSANQTISEGSYQLDIANASFTFSHSLHRTSNPNTYASNPVTYLRIKAQVTGKNPGDTIALTSSTAAQRVNKNDPIGPKLSWGKDGLLFYKTTYGGAYGNFKNGKTGYIGISFNAAGGAKNYGWVNIAANSTDSYRITDWAYQTDGTAILAGDTIGPAAVPEPTSLALIAMGAGGLAIFRKRKQEKEG